MYYRKLVPNQDKNLNFIYKCFENLNSKNIFYKYFSEEKKYLDLKNFYINFTKNIKNERLKIVTFSDKSFEMYASIVSIFLTNNIWIPLSYNLPTKRIIDILIIAKPNLIILDEKSKILQNSKFQKSLAKMKIKIVYYKNFEDKKNINSHNIIIPKFNLESPSMIYFTSGSTGNPKGVIISYNNFISCFMSKEKILYKNNKKLVFGDYHDPSFVISLVILFPCIYLKSTISPSKNVYETINPISHIKKNKVNILITVPSTISRIKELKDYNSLKKKFKFIIMCGEPLTISLANFILDKINPDRLYNFYGSTEVSPWIFYYQLNKNNLKKLNNFEFVPVGKPLDKVKIKIKNNELIVSGPVVSLGYVEKKQNNGVFFKKDKKIWFKTKDQIVKHNNIYFIKGRIDKVVKIQGYRVDLGDIEQNLRKINKIKDSIVYLQSYNKRKILSCVISSDYRIKSSKIINQLSQNLPNYMIPKRIFVKKKFPYNRSGKIDRKKLMI